VRVGGVHYPGLCVRYRLEFVRSRRRLARRATESCVNLTLDHVVLQIRSFETYAHGASWKCTLFTRILALVWRLGLFKINKFVPDRLRRGYMSAICARTFWHHRLCPQDCFCQNMNCHSNLASSRAV
jgi:hypothetical protein